MKLRVEDSQERVDTIFVRVALVDDTDPAVPVTLVTEDFVFAADSSPEQCATEIQRRFDDRQRSLKGVRTLAAAFPPGKELPVVTELQARSVLGL